MRTRSLALLLALAAGPSALSLPASAAELGKITVTGEEENEAGPLTTTTVTTAELEEQQAQNFEDAIRYIPGVSIVDMGRFGDNGFNIRGLEGDRVAMTVDGLPFAEAVETTPAYEFFRSGRGSVDIDSLKSIEVTKGADSITAGSGALGGAVTFTTKDPYDYLRADGNDTYFRVKAGYTSSSDEAMTTATLANRTGRVESMVLYTRREGHEAESWYGSTAVATGSERRTPDPIDRTSDSVLAKLDFVLTDDHRFGLVGERVRAINEIDNLSRVGGSGYLERRADDDNDRDRYGVRFQWENAASFFDTLEWTADRVETSSRGLTTILAGSGCARNILPCLRSEDRSTDQVLDRSALDLTKVWRGAGLTQSFAYGLAWQKRDVDFSAVDTRYIGTTAATDSVIVDPAQVPKTDVANYSLYFRDSLSLLNDRLKLVAGARYDRTEYSPRLDAQFLDDSGTVRNVDFAAPTWQLSGDFSFTPSHAIWARVGRGFRAPTAAEMYAPTSTSLATEVTSGREVSLWNTVANPDLESEKSLSKEIGYRWRSARHQLGISVYHDKYTNFVEDIAFTRNADVSYRTCSGRTCSVTLGNRYTMPSNFGAVTVKGVEVEGRWSISDQWSARLAWAYSEGEKNNGDPLPSIIPANGVLGLRYAAPSQRWVVTGNLTHSAAKKLEDAVITESADFFESLVPDYLSNSYTVFDLFGDLNLTKGLRLNAGVYNLFDEKYYLWPRVRFVNEGTTTLYGYVTGDGIGRYSEPGRNYRVSLAWQFWRWETEMKSMNRTLFVSGLLAASALLLSGSVRAHSPFLLPNVFDVSNRDHVTVQGSFTEEFFSPDVAMKADDYHVIAPDGTKVSLKPVYTRDLAIVEAETKATGTYRISTGIRTGRTAKAAWVNGDWTFLGRDESPPAGGKAYDVTSVTVAETYVSRGKPSAKALAARNSGLEFRPISHPSSLFVGEDVTFEVLFDGKPVAGETISVYRDNARYSDGKAVREVKTDGGGKFAFKPEAQGVYLAMTRYRPAPRPESRDGGELYVFSGV